MFYLFLFIFPTLCFSKKMECNEWSSMLIEATNCIVDSIEVLKNDTLEFDKVDANLDSLYFQGCKFAVFPVTIFTAFPKMTTLSIADSKMRQLTAKIFENAGNLGNIKFTNTSIKILKNKVFVKLGNLSSLTINKNGLKNILVNSFQVT